MEKVFALIVGLNIFFATNFANAAHYYVYSEKLSDDFTQNFYVDSDSIGVIYSDNNQLKFSKNQNIAKSNSCLFKAKCIVVEEWLENGVKKQNNFNRTYYFYRGLSRVDGYSDYYALHSFSVFNDKDVSEIIGNLTGKKEVAGLLQNKVTDMDKEEGTRVIQIDGNGAFSCNVKTYGTYDGIKFDLVYKKARELFGVQNYYGKMTKTHDERKSRNSFYDNYLKKFSDNGLHSIYCGMTDISDSYTGTIIEYVEWHYVSNSSTKTNNGLTCVVKKIVTDNYTKIKEEPYYIAINFYKDGNGIIYWSYWDAVNAVWTPQGYLQHDRYNAYPFIRNIYNLAMQELR